MTKIIKLSKILMPKIVLLFTADNSCCMKDISISFSETVISVQFYFQFMSILSLCLLDSLSFLKYDTIWHYWSVANKTASSVCIHFSLSLVCHCQLALITIEFFLFPFTFHVSVQFQKSYIFMEQTFLIFCWKYLLHGFFYRCILFKSFIKSSLVLKQQIWYICWDWM